MSVLFISFQHALIGEFPPYVFVSRFFISYLIGLMAVLIKKIKSKRSKYYSFSYCCRRRCCCEVSYLLLLLYLPSPCATKVLHIQRTKNPPLKKKYLQRLENWIRKRSVPNLYPAISERMFHTKREEVQLEQGG